MIEEKVFIFGSGGHTRSLTSLLCDQKIYISGIYDNSFDPGNKEFINSIELLGSITNYKENAKIILSIGDNLNRKEMYLKYSSDLYLETVIHSRSFVDESAQVGKANFVFANSIINAKVVLKDNNIINTAAIIEHEVEIGSHNHISVGSILCGRVKIGDCCFIGAGSVINDKISICNNVTIGSNSTVIKSIEIPGIYAGNPVRKIG